MHKAILFIVPLTAIYNNILCVCVKFLRDYFLFSSRLLLKMIDGFELRTGP